MTGRDGLAIDEASLGLLKSTSPHSENSNSQGAFIKFYDCATVPSPHRVRIFLTEKGLTVPTVQVDLRNGEQFTPALRALNPDCMVPVLELALVGYRGLTAQQGGLSCQEWKSLADTRGLDKWIERSVREIYT